MARLDEVLRHLYGNRTENHVTKTEHLFKNEEWRNDIFRYIVLREKLIVSESVIPTRTHQRVSVELAKKAERYVQAIEAEYAERDGTPIPKVPSTVHLKVILYSASADTSKNFESMFSKFLVFRVHYSLLFYETSYPPSIRKLRPVVQPDASDAK